MKKVLSILGVGVIAALTLGSCADDVLPVGEGRVLISAKVNSDVKAATRSDIQQTEEELSEKCIIWISNSKGLVRRYQGLQNVPTDGITLLSDHYIVEGWTGDSVSASWDKRWFKGRTEFEVTAGNLTRVDLTCKIANTLVTVAYDESVDDVLENYTLSVDHSRGGLTFEGREDRTGYFMMPTGDSELKWKLQGTLKSDGSVYIREGVISDARQAYKYALKISCGTNNEEFGGVYFTVDVDPSEVVHESEFVIVAAPVIEGYGFDPSQTILGEEGTFGRRSVFVKSAVGLKSVILESSDFPELLDLGGADIDLMKMSLSVANQIAENGISHEYMPAEDGSSMMKISFEKEYLNRMKNGMHEIKISATDANGKTSTMSLTWNVSDAAAVAEATTLDEVWSRTATLHATVSKDGVEHAAFAYRKQGDSEWTEVEPVAENASRAVFAKGTRVKVDLSDLQPATTYEWQFVADDFRTDLRTFTTGAELQLPNSSFEGWQGTSPLLIYAQGESMFWDSGNHGSATLKKNVTVSTNSMVHSGNLAISLESQKVAMFGIGKFAAGNVFAGKYLKTDGTDGVLGWGRAFAARPKQLKVWAHYTPAAINERENDAPAEYVKGEPDRGIIYMALMDDYTQTFEGEKFPVIVKTKAAERALFDVDSDKYRDHVIAYGQHIFEGATPGSQLVEVTIDLDYRRTDIIPSYIVLTASASKGGDYFTGGDSRLVLDDIELVY
ncbi:MAG: DUF4493 domain-containing protein [Muribaculaceae bacterium]|nr:DUF4493 domain-containing protein [Muribaculaceae bacterium]